MLLSLIFLLFCDYLWFVCWFRVHVLLLDIKLYYWGIVNWLNPRSCRLIFRFCQYLFECIYLVLEFIIHRVLTLFIVQLPFRILNIISNFPEVLSLLFRSWLWIIRLRFTTIIWRSNIAIIIISHILIILLSIKLTGLS